MTKRERLEPTPEMIEAGIIVLRRAYGQAGEPIENFQRVVEEIFDEMLLAHGPSRRSL